jgi:hypothetical protein
MGTLTRENSAPASVVRCAFYFWPGKGSQAEKATTRPCEKVGLLLKPSGPWG